MCADYQRRQAYRAYVEEMSRRGMNLHIPSLNQAPNLEPQDDVRPTNQAPIFRQPHDADGLEMVFLRWGLIPWFFKGHIKEFRLTTFNARAETISKTPSFKMAFARRRCLIPADGWYEFKGKKSPKSKFLFTERGEEWFCFAGLWDRAETANGVVESFTMVTGAPGPMMLPYHHRAPIILRREEWGNWMDPEFDVNPILLRESEDRFDVRQIR